MKRTRRERKAYEQGRAAGYAEGYKNGLHDGNPFNAIIDAVTNFAELCAEVNIAEVRAELAELMKDDPDNLNTLEIEGGDNDTFNRCFTTEGGGG